MQGSIPATSFAPPILSTSRSLASVTLPVLAMTLLPPIGLSNLSITVHGDQASPEKSVQDNHNYSGDQ